MRKINSKTDRAERDIAKQCGVTVTGLKALMRAAAGHRMPGGVATVKLCRDGLAVWDEEDRQYYLNAAGNEVARKARSMGW